MITNVVYARRARRAPTRALSRTQAARTPSIPAHRKGHDLFAAVTALMHRHRELRAGHRHVRPAAVRSGRHRRPAHRQPRHRLTSFVELAETDRNRGPGHRCAVASPIPLLPPVITATLPSNRDIILRFSCDVVDMLIWGVRFRGRPDDAPERCVGKPQPIWAVAMCSQDTARELGGARHRRRRRVRPGSGRRRRTWAARFWTPQRWPRLG
jgi:hypothetical protein